MTAMDPGNVFTPAGLRQFLAEAPGTNRVAVVSVPSLKSVLLMNPNYPHALFLWKGLVVIVNNNRQRIQCFSPATGRLLRTWSIGPAVPAVTPALRAATDRLLRTWSMAPRP